jgi:hypothetical protein
MELFLIYLWLKLDAFIFISVALCVSALIALGIYYMIRHDEWLNNRLDKDTTYTAFDKKHKIIKRTLLITISLLFTFAVVTPSAKDTAILVGASYAIDLAKSPEGQKIQTLIRKKANDFLDEQLKEKK